MRKALGLAETRPKKVRTEASQPVRYTIVELSVRKGGAGLPLRFEHRSRSISKVTAQLEAEKEAKRQGYQVWASRIVAMSFCEPRSCCPLLSS
ncbi:hypothetical protein RI649_08080 [Pseudomonas aeruginosa]|uniref:hypothetical protein n=1 Tax=Pseudomonas aeruginosa TaxID=287 RepID=UPI00301BC44D